MEEEIVQNYLLKSARLITTAPRFKADLLRAAEQKRGSEFVPISRFGIGLLSCFVAGDQVEINTRYLNTDGELSDGDA